MYKIYKHTLILDCPHKGWSYIGQTSQDNLNIRWQNGYGYKNCTIFWRAIKKYGWDNFSHEIIEDGIETLDEANKQECYWISYYHTWIDDPECRGYNSTTGGNNLLSEKVKNKISKTLLGHTVSEEAREKARQKMLDHPTNYWLGKNRTEETKEKCRQALLGRVEPEEQRAKVTAGLFKYYLNSENNRVRKDGSMLCTPVRCIETNEIFFSVNEAARQKSPKHNVNGAGHIKDVCKGKRKTAFGYHWEYINN